MCIISAHSRLSYFVATFLLVELLFHTTIAAETGQSVVNDPVNSHFRFNELILPFLFNSVMHRLTDLLK